MWPGHIAAGQRPTEAGRHGPQPPGAASRPHPHQRRRGGPRPRLRCRPRRAAPAAAHEPGSGHCTRIDKAEVKGAEHVETACLSDLTPTGTTRSGHTNPLLPIATDSDAYDRLIDARGAGRRHRYHRIADGTRTDGLHGSFPDRLRPMLPCARTAFGVLTSWVERGVRPPADATYPRPGGGVLNACTL